MRHWFWILLIALGLQAQEARIQILGTTDMHGHVMAEDTFTLQPANLGWAKIATLIRRQKAVTPDTILLDCGDAIQGEPIDYVRNALRRDLPEPSVAIMNALGYAAMAVGNHEYDFGLDLLREVEKQAKFPFLSANTLTAKGTPAFPSHVLVTVGGVRVALVGFTTPRTAALAGPQSTAGFVFRDIVAASDTPTVYSAPLIARTMGMFQTMAFFEMAQGEGGAPLISVAVPSLLFDDVTIRKPGGQIPQLPVSTHPYFGK